MIDGILLHYHYLWAAPSNLERIINLQKAAFLVRWSRSCLRACNIGLNSYLLLFDIVFSYVIALILLIFSSLDTTGWEDTQSSVVDNKYKSHFFPPAHKVPKPFCSIATCFCCSAVHVLKLAFIDWHFHSPSETGLLQRAAIRFPRLPKSV